MVWTRTVSQSQAFAHFVPTGCCCLGKWDWWTLLEAAFTGWTLKPWVLLFLHFCFILAPECESYQLSVPVVIPAAYSQASMPWYSLMYLGSYAKINYLFYTLDFHSIFKHQQKGNNMLRTFIMGEEKKLQLEEKLMSQKEISCNSKNLAGYSMEWDWISDSDGHWWSHTWN